MSGSTSASGVITGSTVTSNQPGSFATDSPADFYQNFSYIVGMPHSYLPSADPNGRTFTRHMLMTPPLVMIRPGRVQYTNSKGLANQIASAIGGNASDVASIFDVSGGANGTFFDKAHQYGADASDLAALNMALKQKLFGTSQDFVSANGAPPIRYFEFVPAVDEYMSVLATMSSRLYARMTAWNTSNPLNQLPWLAFDDDQGGAGGPKPEKYGGFITYWADNASSVSESATTDTGQSAVAAAVNGLAETSRQAQFFLGSDSADASKGAGGYIGDAFNGITKMLAGGLGANGEKASGIASAIGDAVLGLNPLFPEIWKNSAFTRTYDISFKFFSPYGAPGAVYQNVLLPFAQLLSLVLPIMRNPGTYSEPFVFQVDCPGHFSCDIGICTGFTFTRGGPDHLWTKDGLPRQIDVNMQIKDLYPTLMASHNNASLYCNVGLGTFLDNLAGINLFTSTQATSPLTLLQTKLQRFLTIGEEAPQTIKANVTNWLFKGTGGQIAALFRGQ